MVAAPVKIAAAQYPIERFATLGAYHDKLARWVTDREPDWADVRNLERTRIRRNHDDRDRRNLQRPQD